jgi:Yip1-like protein
MAELIREPAWLGTWVLILILTALGAGAFLSTNVGRQAVVDERVRVIEAFGGAVDDAQYARLEARPPWWVYFTSGGRLLLTPPITVLAALGCWALARTDGEGARFSQALAIVVHASVVLVLGQLLLTPLHFVRESLTSPLNLTAILPGMDEGTLPARFFGSIDLFALWWMVLVAIGLAALTRRNARRYAVSFALMYFGFAAVTAGVIAAVGGI